MATLQIKIAAFEIKISTLGLKWLILPFKIADTTKQNGGFKNSKMADLTVQIPNFIIQNGVFINLKWRIYKYSKFASLIKLL